VTDAKSIAEKVFREEGGRIVASLIRLAGSFDLAEEAMQEAFASELVNWHTRGIPEKPGAWITAGTNHTDQLRQRLHSVAGRTCDTTVSDTNPCL
jgi:RNA polymerase sigma-70 factor (ECF subfamily)